MAKHSERYRVVRVLGPFCYRFRTQERTPHGWRTIQTYSALFVPQRWAKRRALKLKQWCVDNHPQGGAYAVICGPKVVG